MAYIRKTKSMLALERDYNIDDIRTALMQSYARNNTLQAVAREFNISPTTMSQWFKQLGLHTRASLPAVDIPQDLSDLQDDTDYNAVPDHPRSKPTASATPATNGHASLPAKSGRVSNNGASNSNGHPTRNRLVTALSLRRSTTRG